MSSESSHGHHHISAVQGLGRERASSWRCCSPRFALWTAIPLGWIWIGSKVSETQFPAEGPYAVVAIGILVTILVDAWLIGRLNDLYIRITGTNRLAPMRPTWLKSMRDTRPDRHHHRRRGGDDGLGAPRRRSSSSAGSSSSPAAPIPMISQ